MNRWLVSAYFLVAAAAPVAACDERLESADKRAAKDDTLVALLLSSGLQDTFPFEKTGG